MSRDFPFLEQYSDPSGVSAYMSRESLLHAHVCMPVKVLAVTRTGGVEDVGTVDCQPLIDLIDHEGRIMKNAPIYGLPYIRLQAGGNAVIIDPQPGDVGIAVFCDRDISSFMANGGEHSPPGSRRIHSLSDGIYIASIITQEPKQYIRFFDGGIEVSSPVHVSVTAPAVTVTAPSVTVAASEKVRMETPRLEVTGDIIDNCDGGTGKTMASMRTTYDIHTHNENNTAGGHTQQPNQSM